MVQCLKIAISEIDKNMVQNWIEDLVINKTFTGMKFQYAILKSVSEKLNKDFRLSVPEEESKGIDGYIGDQPVSIKPTTYNIMQSLPEQIEVPIITYLKEKNKVTVDYSSLE